MQESSLTLPSFAKINLGLRILRKREDGYHELVTTFQTISLADTLTFTSIRSGEISLICDDPTVPVGDRNIIVKAANALSDKSGRCAGASITLEKKIPSPGGLGGGSSNAAVTLLALAKLWDLKAGIDELEGLAAELGSDVPFFLRGGAMLGTGRGVDLSDAQEFSCKHIVVVTPDVEIPTAGAFAALNAHSLTKNEGNRILSNYRFRTGSGELDQAALKNDFEDFVFSEYPETARAKNMLLELGAKLAALSGSGASVFAVFDNENTRQTAMKALGIETNWRSFAVATISRSQYREAFKQVL
ncbi:MAG: 4-(cytidine 5'-diphospho)-2-C-methyl-D-erythritol kinase [Blastocatellia bacterium]|nr:4-(cytidine 5'-diphospho)-2-C-methyl-D-erythritol kinase [Blastocatellia bacterium]